jgi:hypothetical protein
LQGSPQPKRIGAVDQPRQEVVTALHVDSGIATPVLYLSPTRLTYKYSVRQGEIANNVTNTQEEPDESQDISPSLSEPGART